ncbi:MAG: hypothetical protein SH856_14845 [Flavobacteriales bacterium]|nr:hypothetical protein [Flavobacteriales bacterium]
MSKKIRQMLLLTLLTVVIASCSETKEERRASRDLKNYVDSMDRANMEYTEENWVAIDNGYQSRSRLAEADMATMSDEDKRELESVRKKYADLQARYEMEMKKHDHVVDSKVTLRNALFGEGMVSDDMSFSFVTASNLLSTYKSFVDAVDQNRDTYTREDWDEIKLLYEALDTRKNMVEKELSGPDNREIAALKIKVSSIYDTNRPGSKAQENSDAKE